MIFFLRKVDCAGRESEARLMLQRRVLRVNLPLSACTARGFLVMMDAADRPGSGLQAVGQDKRDGATWASSCCLHIVFGGATWSAMTPKWCHRGGMPVPGTGSPPSSPAARGPF
jgi:hypothetical protein